MLCSSIVCLITIAIDPGNTSGTPESNSNNPMDTPGNKYGLTGARPSERSSVKSIAITEKNSNSMGDDREYIELELFTLHSYSDKYRINFVDEPVRATINRRTKQCFSHYSNPVPCWPRF